MEHKWAEITDDYLFNLENVFALYDTAFPIDVREPHDVFMKGLKYAKNSCPNNFHFLVGLEGGQVVSFAIGHYLADVNSGYIVYIATHPLARGKGLGSQTLRKMEELLIQDAKAADHSILKSMILETEIEEQVHSKVEKEDCIKREHFYEKNNYKRHDDIHYLQPPLNGGEESIPLHIFTKNFQGNTLEREDVRRLIQAVYREKYYHVNGIDINILRHCLEEMGIDRACF